MIYFDNAATGGRKPDRVLTAVQSTLKVCANPGRSGHKLSLSCARLVQQARNVLNDFFDGYGFDRVVFTKNCTEALNIAIFGVLKQGDHVVLSAMEHNSVLRPLEILRKRGVITYDVCPLDNNGNVNADSFATLLKPNTKMAIVTSASNVTGAIPPLQEIRSKLPQDVLFLCDGAQGAGHISLKMRQAGVDLLTIAGHKGMMGIQGSGALLFSDRIDPAPLLYGGTGSMSISMDMPDFYPDELEAGTLSYPAVISLLEGTRYLSFHQNEVSNTLLQLTSYCIHQLHKIKEIRVYSQPNPCGIVALRHTTLPSEHLSEILSSKYDIAVRGGLHCAPLMHEALGTLDDGLLRISFSSFNSEREIDLLIAAFYDLQTTVY